MVKLIKDDEGFDLNFQLKNADGSNFDLTGNTGLTFKMALTNASVSKVSAAMVVDDATNGLAHYTFATGDLDCPGTYNQEVEVTFAGIIVTFPGEQIIVVEDLP